MGELNEGSLSKELRKIFGEEDEASMVVKSRQEVSVGVWGARGEWPMPLTPALLRQRGQADL